MAAISFFFFSSRRRHTRSLCDWSSDVCSSDLADIQSAAGGRPSRARGGRRPLPDKAFFAARTADCRRAGGRHARSEERRVGKECKSRWSPDQLKKKEKKKLVDHRN